MISLTKAVRFDKKHFLREILGAGVRGVTSAKGRWLEFSIFRVDEREVRTVAGVEANGEA